MNGKWIPRTVLIVVCGGLAGCVTAPKEEHADSAYTPPSRQPESSSDHWKRRDREDRAAVARSIADGKGP